LPRNVVFVEIVKYPVITHASCVRSRGDCGYRRDFWAVEAATITVKQREH
jgi:hypothetical protein